MVTVKKSLGIAYDIEGKRLDLTCEGDLVSEEFREGLLEALQFAQERNVKQWLLDFRKIGKLNEEEETWVQVELFPKIMMMLGTDNYVAIVLSEKCYQNLLNEAGLFGLKSYNSFIIMNTFCELGDAMAWLDSNKLRCA